MDIFRLHVSPAGELVLTLSLWTLAVIALVSGLLVWLWRRRVPHRRFEVVEMNVELGGIGSVKIRPATEDIAIAHRIWTELVTRKAALEIEPDHDVIHEIYNSWYALFGRIRELIADVPATLLRDDPDTRKLVRVATDALNLGLRPHLTRWQAEYRNWYDNQKTLLETQSPQQVQRLFPEYDALIKDMLSVNRQLIQYAAELEKLVSGRSE